MEFGLSKTMMILERTPGVLRALLDELPDDWTHRNDGGETWSPYDVVGHLIHGERTDWIVRAKIILEHGPAKTFERYDRFAQFTESKGKTLKQLLDEFAALRKKNLEELRSFELSEEQLDKKGTHPVLGEVTLRQLLATWTAHDLTHLNQVTKVMARQYKDAMGPWIEFFNTLKE